MLPRRLPGRRVRRPPAARREGPAARPARARGPGAVTWWGSSCLPWLGYRCSPRVAAAAALFVNTEDNEPGGSGRGGGGAGRAARRAPRRRRIPRSLQLSGKLLPAPRHVTRARQPAPAPATSNAASAARLRGQFAGGRRGGDAAARAPPPRPPPPSPALPACALRPGRAGAAARRRASPSRGPAGDAQCSRDAWSWPGPGGPPQLGRGRLRGSPKAAWGRREPSWSAVAGAFEYCLRVQAGNLALNSGERQPRFAGGYMTSSALRNEEVPARNPTLVSITRALLWLPRPLQ